MNSSTSRGEMTPHGKLRILETTDLHMHIMGYDYFSDRPDDSIGLSVLADLIAAQRSKDNTTTLLFDNGDFLQGNPLADYVADMLPDDSIIHPMAAAMNVLGYDAVTLGNHDFDFGLPFLQRTLQQMICPAVSANIRRTNGTDLVPPFVILPASITCGDGKTRQLQVGVTGFGPPQIAAWNDDQSLHIADILGAAKAIVPDIKAAGADIIIALSHSGIGTAQQVPQMENAALLLAAIAGIDVVLAGHTHDAFPDPARQPGPGFDPVRGLLHQKPAVMAACYGRALGVIDLDLSWHTDGWQIDKARVCLDRPNDTARPASKPRRLIEALVADHHQATLARMRKPIARLAAPVNSFFATVVPDLSQQLLARAMRDKVSAILDHEGPVLAAVSPFRTTGRGANIDAPTGLITQRHAAAIFPFNDRICAVRRTGLQIRDWLERAAGHYQKINAGQHIQELIDPRGAGYNCDAIYGLNYTFDLSGPARFDAYGNLLNPQARRVDSLTWNGETVADSDTFVVATSSFRIKGGGGFPRIGSDDIVWMSDTRLRDVLIASLKNAPCVAGPPEAVWQFKHLPDTVAQFVSAPEAAPYASANIRYDGPAPDGRAIYSLVF